MMREAYHWYEEKQSGLGERFILSLENVFDKIIHHPTHFSFVYKSFKQARLKQFPFVIIYELIENEVVIFAVFHSAQNRHYE